MLQLKIVKRRTVVDLLFPHMVQDRSQMGMFPAEHVNLASVDVVGAKFASLVNSDHTVEISLLSWRKLFKECG